MIESDEQKNDERALVAAATGGDEDAFAALSRRYRRELHVHCYRLVASFENAEDLVQETLLRGWQKRETYEGRASFRAWLYRIATNACLDFLEKHKRLLLESDLKLTDEGLPLPASVPWLQPYPDRLLDQVAPGDQSPDAKLVVRETIELAYIVALQFLPPRQRAALILCDVLDWSASETASLLDSSVASVNGALRRARATLRDRQPSRATTSGDARREEQALVAQYVAATERCDVDTLARLLRDDAQFSMPPTEDVWAGRDAIVKSWAQGGFGQPPYNDFKCVATYANRLPVVVAYLRSPGESEYRPLSMDVLRIDSGLVAETTTFDASAFIEAFALPLSLA